MPWPYIGTYGCGQLTHGLRPILSLTLISYKDFFLLQLWKEYNRLKLKDIYHNLSTTESSHPKNSFSSDQLVVDLVDHLVVDLVEDLVVDLVVVEDLAVNLILDLIVDIVINYSH